MPSIENIRGIQKSFEEQEGLHGFTNPRAVAKSLTRDPRSPLFHQVEQAVCRMPTEDFLYEGARETIQNLLASGDQVTIWTQGYELGQLWKVANSGLGQLRKALPPSERTRFSVSATREKFSALPSLFEKMRENGIRRAIIVDDKAQNIAEAASQVDLLRNASGLPRDLVVQLVWVNQGRTKNQVPQNFNPEEFRERFTTVEDIRELPKIRGMGEEQIGWLLDLDHTLLNTTAAKENLFSVLAGILEPDRPLISPEIDERLGLNGDVCQMTELKDGMSGARVLRIETEEESIVAKHNPTSPHVIEREIDGYSLLQLSPLAPHILPPLRTTSKDDGLLVLPYFPGLQLREGLRAETLPVEVAQGVLSRLLDIKMQWWAEQSKLNPDGNWVSMQRSEWQDTLAKVNKVLYNLSQEHGLSVQDLWKAPWVWQDKEYPPFLAVMTRVAQMLETHPPYVIFVHGDATGANILVNPQTGEWRVIDAEWSGLADPAEALVRMVKYESTTTLQSLNLFEAQLQEGRIRLEMSIALPQGTIALQQYGLSKTRTFEEVLEDPEFRSRFNKYLAGSYVREVALTTKRGRPEFAFFAIIKAAEAISN